MALSAVQLLVGSCQRLAGEPGKSGTESVSCSVRELMLKLWVDSDPDRAVPGRVMLG
ncbi:hypothetical protein [Streptomyces sp. NPDC056227]|uniref:hypothetical protein n=1 Tax=Streptomyces sp. NPDC056227 TaxID=3345753 RepID=UPI0035DCA852